MNRSTNIHHDFRVVFILGKDYNACSHHQLTHSSMVKSPYFDSETPTFAIPLIWQSHWPGTLRLRLHPTHRHGAPDFWGGDVWQGDLGFFDADMMGYNQLAMRYLSLFRKNYLETMINFLWWRETSQSGREKEQDRFLERSPMSRVYKTQLCLYIVSLLLYWTATAVRNIEFARLCLSHACIRWFQWLVVWEGTSAINQKPSYRKIGGLRATIRHLILGHSASFFRLNPSFSAGLLGSPPGAGANPHTVDRWTHRGMGCWNPRKPIRSNLVDSWAWLKMIQPPHKRNDGFRLNMCGFSQNDLIAASLQMMASQ